MDAVQINDGVQRLQWTCLPGLGLVDAMLDQGFSSTDDKKREALAIEAATLALRNYGAITLHHQIASWAMRANLNYAARTDEYTFAHHVLPQ
mgnify:CR=1 FL=1